MDPIPPPFTVPRPRSFITHEWPLAGTHPVPWHSDQDWLDFHHMGGGSMPADYCWTSNPREEQERVSCG